MTLERQTLLRRISSFALLQITSLITPFLVLPILARTTSTSGWAAIAIGQSIGGIFAIVVTWGWPLVGPGRIATLSLEEANAEYLQSVRVRAFVLFGLLPIACTAAWLLGPEGYQWECLLMAASGAAMGLSPAWFAVGLGRPSILGIYELAPRAVAMLASALIMILTQQIIVYPMLLLSAALLGPALFSWHVGRRTVVSVKSTIRGSLRENSTAVLTEFLGGSYSTSTTALVAGAASTHAAATYSAAEKVYRIGLFAVSSLSNALQGWIISAPHSERHKRLRISLLTHSGLGAFGGAVLLVWGPWLTEQMFTSQLRATSLTCAWLGLAYMAISVNTALGRHYLALSGHMRPVLVSTAVGSLVGIPGILLGALSFGSEGAAAALAVSEIVVVAVQVAAIRFRRLSEGRVAVITGEDSLAPNA